MKLCLTFTKRFTNVAKNRKKISSLPVTMINIKNILKVEKNR